MKVNTKYSLKEIAELLESDDELPDFYDDIPSIPAYQNDSRFDTIKFNWLDKNRSPPVHQKNHNKQEPNLRKQIASKEITDNEDDKKILISAGLLTKRDIFFVKSIEESTTDKTLLWFINFLKFKSIQPKTITSCLVWDITNDDGCNIFIDPLSNFNTRYYLKLVVN